MCIFLQNLYPFIRGKFMIINSEYDAWAIPNLMKIPCLKEGVSGFTLSNCSKDEMDYIEKYRASYRQLLSKFFVYNQELSLWSIACSNHVYAAF